MASIPLPALDVHPPQPAPDPMAQYGRLLQLRTMMQEEPLRQQALQQGIQSGQLDIQQKQIALKDQQAMSAAMKEWSQQAQPSGEGQSSSASSGPSYDDLIRLAEKNGASFNAIKGIQQYAMDMKAKAASIALDDAKTGASNADALKTKNGMLTDAMSGVANLPDDQIAQGLLSTAQQLAQKGLLDPQHVQMAQQLAQWGDPEAIRQQLRMQITGMGGFTKLLDAAQKQMQTANEARQAAFYAQAGGAPGVSTDMMQQADWLKKNPGKGPSDFLLWKQQHAPYAMFMGNQLTPQGTDLAAQNLLLTGQAPSGLYRSPGTQAAVYNRAAQMNGQSGGAGIAANKATFQANETSLKSLQKNYDQVQAFEGTAEKNIDLLQDTAKKIPDLNARFANVPVRMFNSRMIGTENMAAFNTALNTAQTEAAKVLNSSNATGVLSDSARHELQAIIDGNLSYPALVASLNTLKQDMANRTQAYQLQINGIQDRIKKAGTGAATVQGGNQPQLNTDKNNDPLGIR